MKGLQRWWAVAIFVVGALLGLCKVTGAGPSYIDAKDQALERCRGEFKGRPPTPTELKRVLNNHAIWVRIYISELSSPKAQADSRKASMCGADLEGADLSGVALWGADLTGARLMDADLSGAELGGADLSGAELGGANLSKAKLWRTNLSGADLEKAKFGEAKLWETNLSKAKMWGTDLSGADLQNANLSGADLQGSDLSEAKLNGADMSGVVFEPRVLPEVDTFAYAANIGLMYYNVSPQALIKMRKAFAEAGFYERERETTYAIKHYETMKSIKAWHDVPRLLEGVFCYILFDYTTLWGSKPGRSLLILLAVIAAFAVPYVFVLIRPGANGIWRKWSDDRVRTDLGSKELIRLNVGWREAVVLGLYFSALSAFNIGWRELNVGGWIQRIQIDEYTLKASGWVRSVSGVQALIGLYLLAIWALTYFGRPFQ